MKFNVTVANCLLYHGCLELDPRDVISGNIKEKNIYSLYDLRFIKQYLAKNLIEF